MPADTGTRFHPTHDVDENVIPTASLPGTHIIDFHLKATLTAHLRKLFPTSRMKRLHLTNFLGYLEAMRVGKYFSIRYTDFGTFDDLDGESFSLGTAKSISSPDIDDSTTPITDNSAYPTPSTGSPVFFEPTEGLDSNIADASVGFDDETRNDIDAAIQQSKQNQKDQNNEHLRPSSLHQSGIRVETGIELSDERKPGRLVGGTDGRGEKGVSAQGGALPRQGNGSTGERTDDEVQAEHGFPEQLPSNSSHPEPGETGSERPLRGSLRLTDDTGLLSLREALTLAAGTPGSLQKETAAALNLAKRLFNKDGSLLDNSEPFTRRWGLIRKNSIRCGPPMGAIIPQITRQHPSKSTHKAV